MSFPIEPGRHFGELRIERELGRGAFGTVFLARDSLLHRLVALKVVRTPSGELGEEQREQALREARLVAGLQSPQIVTLYRVHSLPEGAVKTHVSLFDGTLEGFRLDHQPVFSVQYHPEASPGPQDSHYLFERFVGMMESHA